MTGKRFSWSMEPASSDHFQVWPRPLFGSMLLSMETTSLSDLKSHLSEYADRAELQHERFTITRNGRPAVVMVCADEWGSLQGNVVLVVPTSHS